MRDRLENFINQNREQFDKDVPDLKVWADIEKRLDPPKAKRIPLMRMVGIAASVMLLLAVGVMGGKYIFGSASSENQVVSIDDISPEFGQREQSLKKQINQKRAQLASYNYDASINDDLIDLDETLKELRKELINVPKGSEEQIVEAMLKNYETKVKILEIVLEKIKTNNSKSEEDYEDTEM